MFNKFRIVYLGQELILSCPRSFNASLFSLCIQQKCQFLFRTTDFSFSNCAKQQILHHVSTYSMPLVSCPFCQIGPALAVIYIIIILSSGNHFACGALRRACHTSLRIAFMFAFENLKKKFICALHARSA